MDRHHLLFSACKTLYSVTVHDQGPLEEELETKLAQVMRDEEVGWTEVDSPVLQCKRVPQRNHCAILKVTGMADVFSLRLCAFMLHVHILFNKWGGVVEIVRLDVVEDYV